LHVAKLAGIPSYVLHRAERVLDRLEKQTKSEAKANPENNNSPQLNFFSLDRPELEDLASELEMLNLDELKPIEALMLLSTFKEKLAKK
ncbi:MAG TPA: DNA mismatch repair protein MutS, partial [Cryomorphaceae bacterium]|nr:DNA mismatch repair protein MutS [Cryomorphaceae bacterium]